jgi:undecaprenyl-diphosphatase
LLGYRREAAARYAFLLAVPAVLASGLFELTKIGEGTAPAWGPTIVATLIAFGVGYVVIAWFLQYIATHTFTPFVAYRVVLGVAILTLVAARVLTRYLWAIRLGFRCEWLGWLMVR